MKFNVDNEIAIELVLLIKYFFNHIDISSLTFTYNINIEFNFMVI